MVSLVLLALLMAPPKPPSPPPTPAPSTTTTAPTPSTTTTAQTPSTPATPSTPSTAPPRREGALRIGVVDVAAANVDDLVADVVEDALLVELRKLSRASVIGWKEIRSMIDAEGTKQLAGCEESCLAEIADAAGVDVIVVCSVVRTDQSVLSLRRIDQREAKVVADVQRRMTPASGEEFLAALGPAVAEVFADMPLKKGAVRGVAKEKALALNPPPVPPWATWTTTAAASALLLGGGAAGAVALVQHADYQQYAKLGLLEPIDGQTLVGKGAAANASLNLAVVLGAAGAVVGAGAAVLALFTDWTGAAHAAEEEAP